MGGPNAFYSNHKQKLCEREVHLISIQPVQYLCWSKQPITFSKKDHWVHIPDLESYALVVTIDRAVLPMLIDGGSSLNIVFTETLKHMDFNFKRLQPYEELFYGIVPSKGSYPIG